MPKRPCALAITPGDRTILCGDKFGDVYSLPLHVSDSSEPTPRPSDRVAAKPFKPSASELTVHTKGNRLALQNQLRTAQKAQEKAPLEFENQLILGHVSLLTDLKYIALPESLSPSGKPREYILTSDRDEHVRVSRGLPQGHITEMYCLGHTEFVSKLCVPDWRRDLLISGGGDSFVVLWRWPLGRLVQKVDLSRPVLDLTRTMDQNDQASFLKGDKDHRNSTESDKNMASTESIHIAITGIWAMKHGPPDETGSGAVFVSCEG
jgi:tRNA (guanine-N(7)-)-methyltransferase subunit TRM82